jgi:hypothetical protein
VSRVHLYDDDNRSMISAAVRWALNAAGAGTQPDSWEKIAGEFEDDAGSKLVMAAAVAVAPALLFGENYLGLDDLQPTSAAEFAVIAAAASHHAVARHFISKCFVEWGENEALFPFVCRTDVASMKFHGKLHSEGGSACKMVIVHLMCCGCIMSASAMVTSPSVIALMARWGFLRWLADIAHVCVQCLLSAEEALKKLAPPPSRTSVVSFLQSSSSSSASATAATTAVPLIVEHMRGRLRVIFDYLQAEAALLQHRPELALQQLQHCAGALADVSNLHSEAARIIHDEARAELEVRQGSFSKGVHVGTSMPSSSLHFARTDSSVPVHNGASPCRITESSSSTAAAAAAAPPLLLLRSYSRPCNKRTRYAP